MKKGICKLCREEKDLSYEHIPPQSAGNKNTRYTKGSFLEFITSDSPLSHKFKGKMNQGGIGFYCYCEDCNNYLGSKYVRSYKEWFKVGLHLINNPQLKRVEFQLEKPPLLHILKQVVSMFVAISEAGVILKNEELIKFISDPKSDQLPENFRVFSYLNRGPKLRYIDFMAKGDLKTGSIVLCAEITFPPFGYVMVVNAPNFDNPLLKEITGFKNIPHENKEDFVLAMNVLETHLPFTLDYRSLNEIQNN